MLSSKLPACDGKKSRLIKEQKRGGLLGSLEIRTPLSQIPLVGPFFLLRYKINEKVSKLY